MRVFAYFFFELKCKKSRAAGFDENEMLPLMPQAEVLFRATAGIYSTFFFLSLWILR